MKPTERKAFFEAHRQHVTAEQMAAMLKVGLPTIRNYEREFGPCLSVAETVREVEPKTLIQAERKAQKLSESEKENKQKLKYLESENGELKDALEAVLELEAYQPELKIKLPRKRKKSESTMVVVASDWHIGKTVDPNVVPGNEFNLEVAHERVERFFQRVVKMLEFEQKEVDVKHVVLALLGDFIEGSLHPDSMETAGTQPIQQTEIVFDMIVAGIEYLLEHTNVSLSVPCIVGNHSRMTDKVRNSTETGYSLESLLYGFLARHFKGNPRVTFHISKSIHFYMDIYNFTLRFMHGHHGLRGGGGVGGLAIPLLRAIGKWDRTRKADITVVAHFHSVLDIIAGIVNGCLCGSDSYSLSMGFPFEKPAQVYFMINSKYGRNGYRKIHLEE